MSLLTAPIVKKIHILSGIYFIFLKKHPKINVKFFQYQVLTSVGRSEKLLASKANFSTFLQVSLFNFDVTLCERPYS